MGSLGLDYAWIYGVYANLPRSQFFGEDARYSVHSAFGGRVDCGRRGVN